MDFIRKILTIFVPLLIIFNTVGLAEDTEYSSESDKWATVQEIENTPNKLDGSSLSPTINNITNPTYQVIDRLSVIANSNIDCECHTSAYVDEETHNLYMWGSNGYDLNCLGELSKRQEPTFVMSDVAQVAVGMFHCTVLKTDGTVWCWGENVYGQVGNGSIDEEFKEPVQVLEDVVQITGNSYTSAALKADGTIYTWGLNEGGELGTGNTEMVTVPTRVEGIDSVKQISLGNLHFGALKEDGTLWMWGDNTYGELGDGTTKSSYSPKLILKNVEQISLGAVHTGALMKNGDIKVWGNNQSGQVGNGWCSNAKGHVKSPFDVPIGKKVKKLILGDLSTAAITDDDSLWMWGSNDYGELGNNSTVNQFLPIKVLENVKSVGIGEHHTIAQKNDGSLWGWGANAVYQVGDKTNEDRLFPVNLFQSEMPTPEVSNPLQIKLDATTIEGPLVEVGTLSFRPMSIDSNLNLGDFTYSQEIDQDKRTIKQIFGVEKGLKASGALSDKDYNDKLFNNIKETVNDSSNYSPQRVSGFFPEEQEMNFGIRCKGSVIGYMEYQVDNEGKAILKDGGAIIVIKTGIDLPKYKLPPAEVVAVKLSVDVDSEGKLVFKPSNDDYEKLLKMSLSPSLTVSASAGPEQMFKLEGALTGKLKNTINYSSENNKSLRSCLEQKGELSFDFSYIALGLWRERCTLFKCNVDLYPKNTAKDKRGTKTRTKARTASTKMELINRDYLEKAQTLEVSKEQTEYKNVYPYNSPQIVTLDNGKMISLWVEDNGDTNSLSFTDIVYSIKEPNGNWSQKKIIASSGRTNIMPKLQSDGNDCYVIWDRTTKNLPITASPEEFFNNIELACSKFNGNEFEIPQVVPSNSSPIMYTLEVFQGKPWIAWIENSNNDYSLSNGNNTLNLNNLSDISLNVKDLGNDINSLAVNNGELYYMDKEGDITNLNRIDLNGNDSTILTFNDEVSNLKSFNHELYWSGKSKVLYQLENDKAKLVTDNCPENFCIISNSGNRSVITNVENGYKSELYISHEINGEWSEPSPITFEGEDISAFSASVDPATNKPTLIYDKTTVITDEITEQNPEPYGNTDLIIKDFDDYYDLSVEPTLFCVLDDLIPFEKNTYTTRITNTGTIPIKSVRATFSTNQLDVLSGDTQVVDLKVGETKDIEWSSVFPLDFTGRIYKVSVLVDGLGELDELTYDNNEATFALDPNLINSSSENQPIESEPSNSTVIYRLYNKVSGEHLYTSDENEYNTLPSMGWTQEGTGWNAPEDGTPVYRLYNPALADHLYTTDDNEVRVLTTERGWLADNNGQPLFYSGGSVPIYRLYHEGILRHLLTKDENENTTLGNNGWKQEGVGFKAVS